MSNDLRKQVYSSFNLKETDELLEIWQKNDHVQWSEDAFSVMQEILQERLGGVPPQGEPILEYLDDNDDEDTDKKTDFEFLIDDENLPEFYNPHKVLRLEKWLYKAAIAAIVATIISSLLELPRVQRIVLSYFFNNPQSNSIAWLISIVFFAFAVGLQCLLLYLPLKALGSVLKILMEMEFNSRVPKTKNA